MCVRVFTALNANETRARARYRRHMMMMYTRHLLRRQHTLALTLEIGSHVGLLVTRSLGLVVVLLREPSGDVAFGRALHVQDDQKRRRDDDEQRGGDDAQNVHIRERDLLDGFLRRERGRGCDRRDHRRRLARAERLRRLRRGGGLCGMSSYA